MRYHLMMRTTLDIDADVLLASKELAARRGTTAGKVISDLARSALTGTPPLVEVNEPAPVHGFVPFPKRGKIVTTELVNQLRHEEGL
jgi:hypothetical protein